MAARIEPLKLRWPAAPDRVTRPARPDPQRSRRPLRLADAIRRRKSRRGAVIDRTRWDVAAAHHQVAPRDAPAGWHCVAVVDSSSLTPVAWALIAAAPDASASAADLVIRWSREARLR